MAFWLSPEVSTWDPIISPRALAQGLIMVEGWYWGPGVAAAAVIHIALHGMEQVPTTMQLTSSLRKKPHSQLQVHNPKESWFKYLKHLPQNIKVSNGAKIRNRYNQVPHLTQNTNGKVTNSQKTPQTRAKRSALSQQVTTKHI